MIRILILFALFAAPLPSVAGDPAVADPHTSVRLPPALEAMFLVLIGTVNFNRPGAVEFDQREMNRADKVVRFGSFLKELIRVYGSPKPYKGPKIESLGQYVRLVEPTRVMTGSLRGDMDELFRLMETGTLPESVTVTPDQFSSNVVLVQAKLFEADKSRRLQSLLHIMAGDSSLSPTIVSTLFTGAFGALFTTKGGVSLVRALSNQLNSENVPTPPVAFAPPATPEAVETANPADKKGAPPQQGKNGNQNLQRPVAPVPGSATAPAQSLLGSSLLTVAGAGLLAKATADVLETYHRLGESESGVLELLRKIDTADISDHSHILDQFHARMHDVILPQIYGIGTTAAASPEIQSLSETNPEVMKLIGTFFQDYLRHIPSVIIEDMILDMSRAPDSNDFQTRGLVLSHYGPIAQQFFQTISKMAGLGSFSKMFKKMRDGGAEVQLDQIEQIIKADPNNYPLKNIKLSGKAGKLFQMVYADYENADGSLTPVAVRVLKPGMEKMLAAERVLLHGLAPQLSQALRRPDGSGPSVRRLEELVDLIYWNLHQELRIDLTVANQTAAAARMARRLEVKIEPHEKAILNVFVPRAFPAKPGSKVMVMERVQDIASQEKIATWYSDLPRGMSDALMNITVEELLFKPMAAAQAAKAAKGDGETGSGGATSHPEEGFMHVDLHSGNFLFQEPKFDGEVPEYSVAIIDFGLVSWVKPEHLQELAKLAVGASYNAEPFITEALWALRDVKKMNEWKPKVLEKAHSALGDLVHEKIKQLNASGSFWGVADWVTYVWEEEVLDLPGWVVSLEQGFRAVRSSYLELGRTKEEMHRLEESYSTDQRSLFYNYVMSKTGMLHPGWRTVLGYEVAGCAKRMLGFK